MLGKTSVKDLHGPLMDFMDKLQRENGEEWFAGFKKFLRKENPWPSTASHSWREENGIIYLPPLTTDGTTSEDWIPRLGGKGIIMSPHAKKVLRSPEFKPSKLGTVIEVIILKGTLFNDNDRKLNNIFSYAEAFRTPDNRKLIVPNAELACLIREKLSAKEVKAMDLVHIMTMHKPTNDSGGALRMLVANCAERGYTFDAHHWHLDSHLDRGYGFAFEVSPHISK